jgi:hypothetical protein
MFEKTTVGEWVVLGLSIIFALISGSNFAVVFILSLIVLYIIYRIIIKVHPKSKDWGIILWVIALGGIPIIILIGAGIGMVFISGLASPNYQWDTFSNYGVSFKYPQTIPLNTSSKNYSNVTYYKGEIVFDNPNQTVVTYWFIGKQGALSKETIQNSILPKIKEVFQRYGTYTSQGPIQESTHLGHTIYSVNGEGITKGGKKVYFIYSIWECQNTQRDFELLIGTDKSQDDAQMLFNGVLNSFECH